MKRLLSSRCCKLACGLGLLLPIGMQAAQDTPAAQANPKLSGRELARQIRRDMIKDKTLSATGNNVKIITHGGTVVTLKGPVDTDEEKKTIASLAQRRAGAGNVVDQITIKESNK